MVVFVRNRQDLEHQIILMHAEGWGIRALSRRFNMGRNTIRRILRRNHDKRDKGHDGLDHLRPVARKSKLDAFKPLIKSLLERYPDMTGVRVHEELRENGFDGGQSIVRAYLRKIRPRPKKEPVVRRAANRYTIRHSWLSSPIIIAAQWRVCPDGHKPREKSRHRFNTSRRIYSTAGPSTI
jgi:transposase